MTVTAQIEALISQLTAAKADAVLVDAGKAGAPGKRVRQTAQDVKAGCDTLRKNIIELRNA